MTNWEKYTIGDLCEVGRGSSPRPIIDQRYFKGGTIPWIKIADATASGKYIYETNEHVNEFGASFSRHLDKGSLIIAASGVSLGQIKFLGVKGCIHDGWLYTSNFKVELINKEFLYYFLIYYSEGFHNFSSGAAIQNINTDILRKTIIALPPISVQETIVSIISAYDDLIEVNNQRIKLLEETAHELYKEWFVRMRFPGYKKAKFVKGVPNWDVITFGEIALFIKGMNPIELFENYVQGHKLYVNIEALEGGKVTYCNDKRTVNVNDDEVVMIMDGSRSGVVLKSKAGVLGSTLSVIRPKKGFEDFGSYIFYFLKQNFDWIESNNVGSAIPHANRKFIQKMSLLKPPSELIKRFEEIAKPMEKQIEVLTQQNTQLRKIRDRLLPRLISGKLEVKPNII